LARRQHNPADETLHEIEEGFDRLARWASEHRIGLAAAALAILGMALALDLYRGWNEQSTEAAAAALAETRSAFMAAMGAQPGDVEIPEPANPEVAHRTRREYVERFEAVAEAHPGTPAAAVAYLEAGNLHEPLGAPHLALEAWRAGLEAAPEGSALQALLLQRLARSLEDEGAWTEAAEAHERAGRIEDFPGRWLAMADAARARAEAGQPDAALALFAEIEAAGAVDRIPAYVAARLRELRASRQLRQPR